MTCCCSSTGGAKHEARLGAVEEEMARLRTAHAAEAAAHVSAVQEMEEKHAALEAERVDLMAEHADAVAERAKVAALGAASADADATLAEALEKQH